MLKTSPLFSFFFLAGSLSLALALPVTAQSFCPASGSGNTCYGDFALSNSTGGSFNSAFGYGALYLNATGNNNTANGYYALLLNTTGNNNTASGVDALGFNTTGNSNTANGYQALYYNTDGGLNTASGVNALYSNTTGSYDSANGSYALYSNMTGNYNTANGYGALQLNKTGSLNTGTGYQALYSNIDGGLNTAHGYQALYNTMGNYNTANGYQALFLNTTGNQNTATGLNALYKNTTGSNNTALGYQAGYNLTTGSNNVNIANSGFAGESGVIRIGTATKQTRAFIAGISGVTASGGVQVFINSIGQLGTLTSSKRFKSNIKDLGKVSDKLMKLRPVAFRYKDTAEDGAHSVQYGLIAEEVAKVYPELVQYDENGKPFTVYYHLLTPLILNDLQKEHAESQALKAALKQQGIQLAALKQAQAQQLQMLSKLAVLIQAKAKVQPQKAIYRP